MGLDLTNPLAGAEDGCELEPAADQSRLGAGAGCGLRVPTVEVLGLPLASLTLSQTLETIEQLVQRSRPAFFITANLNYAMLCSRHVELREVNRAAAFLTADGMPLIWGARFKCVKLPGRVTGADLTPQLCALAADRGYPIFILGAENDVAREAALELRRRYPALQIAGVESPNLQLLSAQEEAELVRRIHRSQARLILVAFGQPKGELWIARHYQFLGDAVCVQVGAAIDFAAGHIPRAPLWMQRLGMEWLYRLYLEPRRLAWRYADNLRFLCRSTGSGLPGALAAWWRLVSTRRTNSQ